MGIILILLRIRKEIVRGLVTRQFFLYRKYKHISRETEITESCNKQWKLSWESNF